MARYILTTTVVGQPPSGTYTKWRTGTTIADTAGNAIAGDVVWPQLTNAPSPVNMRPLDAAAAAIMGLPVTTAAALAALGGIGGGVGTDAGD